jgi:hypothetical protein
MATGSGREANQNQEAAQQRLRQGMDRAENRGENMTPNAAKKIIRAELEARKLPYTKLTAKTIGFVDLARDSKIFVSIHGWKPNPAWDELQRVAHSNGFCIEDKP